MEKCHQISFITRSQTYSAELPEVTNVDDFIRMAFLDTEPTPGVGGKSNWDRCFSRRMMHLICSELSKVESFASADVKHHFSLSTFKETLGICFSSKQQGADDQSFAIMWKTTASSTMYSWDDFSPLLLLLSDNPVPSVARASIIAAPMVLGRGRAVVNGKNVRDVFYKNIVRTDCLRIVLMHHLILYRCVLWLEANEVVVQNQMQIKVHYRRFRIGRLGAGLVYELFLAPDLMWNQAKDIIKRQKKPQEREYALKASSEMNKSHWPPGGSLDVDLFKYDREDEQEMDELLDQGNYGDAFIFAQTGVVTKRFLEYLFRIRRVAIERMHAGQSLSKEVCASIGGF
jgi:hypothetical protein